MTGPFAEIVARLEAGLVGREPLPRLDRIMAMAEEILVTWLMRCGAGATPGMVEGSLLLSLHRQSCHCQPGFDTSRDLCREIVARRNVALLYPEEAAQAHWEMAEKVLQLAQFVADVMPPERPADATSPQRRVADLAACRCSAEKVASPELREVVRAC
ncbi:hypothetical protein C8J30_107149 [Rhodobacter viridis]|uniref:Uncharacterized protein n=1 Tax=Rhodobacter viridis TaxID=1054202 RepID=A0A318TYD3_9RHOB|nr:hypothetical protein [Rhodobacter viridis]PYF09777.1 hypothetical protein C8J30_107149 [Rhodobacter viridis]